MGQVVSLAMAQNEFPPLRVGSHTVFMFDHPSKGLYLVNGLVADITDSHVEVDDKIYDHVVRLSVPHEEILERFE